MIEKRGEQFPFYWFYLSKPGRHGLQVTYE